MCIYTSSKVYPYVYLLTHRTTSQFYIGYREANKLPSDQDLLLYKSSSNEVKSLGFENFDSQIIAEFFDGESAFNFEQKLIRESIINPLCINKHYFKAGSLMFRRVGPHSQDTKQKQSNAKIGKKFSLLHRQNLSRSKVGYKPTKESRIKAANWLKDKPLKTEHKKKISESLMNHQISVETKKKISDKLKGKPWSEARRLASVKAKERRLLIEQSEV
jgi:hypothetical protein